MDTLEKVRGSLLVERTEKSILEYMKRESLRMGDRLPNEHDLSEMFGVGRSTIREAVKLLASKNILSVRQGSGTYVKSLTARYMDPLGLSKTKDKLQLAHDLMDVRIMLEPEIAALAAVNADDEDIRRMEASSLEIERLINEGKDYQEEDIAFHSAIAEASGNVVIRELIPVIDAAILLFVSVTDMSLKEETVRTHRLIVDAIRKRDPRQAKHCMTMHLMYNWDTIEERRGKVRK